MFVILINLHMLEFKDLTRRQSLQALIQVSLVNITVVISSFYRDLPN